MIIKPYKETQAMYSPKEIAAKYAQVGAEKTKLPPSKMFLLAVFAGVFIALGAFGSQVVSIDTGKSLGKFLSALVFPVGLLMVIMAGAELFTGNNLILLSVLNKKAKLSGMLKNWAIVYLGNFAGSILIALLLTYSHSYSLFDGKLAQAVVTTGQNKVLLSFSDAFLRGILCNILVCISVWVSFASKHAVGKIIGLFLPIMLFVISGYEHCVANMYFIPAALLVSREYGISADSLTWLHFLIKNLLPVTLGNIVGGAGFVAGGYYLIYLHGNAGKSSVK